MKILTELTVTFLFNAVWQVALVGILTAASAWLLCRIAVRYRHMLWVAALLLSLFLPVLSCVSFFKPVKQPPHVSDEKTSANVFANSAAPVTLFEPVTIDLPRVNEPVQPSQPVTFAPIHINRNVGIGLIAVYALFVFYRCAKLLRAWRRTRAIVHSAYSFELSQPMQTVMRRCRQAIGVKNAQILASSSVAVPITAGVFRSAVVLPEMLLDESDRSLLTSAIGHELVHIVRHDYLLNLIYELIYLPLSFHPSAALIRRNIKRTRELCCDERVTEQLLNPQAYAQSLMRLIAEAPFGKRIVADTTIGVNESDILEVRIMSLLRTSRRTVRHTRLLLILAAVFLITPCVAAAKLALSFDTASQDPSVRSQRAEEKLQRKEQERAREELRRAVRQLQEQLRVAQEAQRPELQGRLRELERALTEQEGLLRQYEDLKQQTNDQTLRQTREELAKNRATQEAQVQEARERLVQLMTQYPRMNQQQIEDLRRAQREVELLAQEQGEKQKEEKLKSKERDEREKQEWKEKEEREKQEWKEKEEREKQEWKEKEERDKDQSEGQVFKMRRSKEGAEREREERARRQIELTRDATVPMDRAIQIATSQVPGKVLACSLGRDGDKLFYDVIIVTTEGDKSTTSYLWVSATDGRILKTEKEKQSKEQEW